MVHLTTTSTVRLASLEKGLGTPSCYRCQGKRTSGANACMPLMGAADFKRFPSAVAHSHVVGGALDTRRHTAEDMAASTQLGGVAWRAFFPPLLRRRRRLGRLLWGNRVGRLCCLLLPGSSGRSLGCCRLRLPLGDGLLLRLIQRIQVQVMVAVTPVRHCSQKR